MFLTFAFLIKTRKFLTSKIVPNKIRTQTTVEHSYIAMFWLRKITTDPHILARKYSVSGL
jgi:hypothetical protein